VPLNLVFSNPSGRSGRPVVSDTRQVSIRKSLLAFSCHCPPPNPVIIASTCTSKAMYKPHVLSMIQVATVTGSPSRIPDNVFSGIWELHRLESKRLEDDNNNPISYCKSSGQDHRTQQRFVYVFPPTSSSTPFHDNRHGRLYSYRNAPNV